MKGTLATLEDGTIAGSVLTMNRAVANFAANTGAPLAAVVVPLLVAAGGGRLAGALGVGMGFNALDGD